MLDETCRCGGLPNNKRLYFWSKVELLEDGVRVMSVNLCLGVVLPFSGNQLQERPEMLQAQYPHSRFMPGRR